MKKVDIKMTKALSFLRLGKGGFTMIELLVVISVIGILAVAVLSSINPIEQINKGRDTRTRSDAAQLLNAVDRYFSIQERYPWNDVNGTNGAVWTPTTSYDEYDEEFVSLGGSAAAWGWVQILSDVQEVKSGFITRLINDDVVIVFKAAGTNETMYACFLPASNSFKREAATNCDESVGVTPYGTGDGVPSSITTCATRNGSVSEDNYICLP